MFIENRKTMAKTITQIIDRRVEEVQFLGATPVSIELRSDLFDDFQKEIKEEIGQKTLSAVEVDVTINKYKGLNVNRRSFEHSFGQFQGILEPISIGIKPQVSDG